MTPIKGSLNLKTDKVNKLVILDKKERVKNLINKENYINQAKNPLNKMIQLTTLLIIAMS